MFILDYLYVPMSGTAYVTTDVCDSFEVIAFNDNEMRIEFKHSAWNKDRERVRFNSFVVIPKQKISVRQLVASEIYPGALIEK